MAKKQVLFDDKLRAALKDGADDLANTVRVTLGPAGRNVILDKTYGSPTVTSDGVTIAKDIDFKIEMEVGRGRGYVPGERNKKEDKMKDHKEDIRSKTTQDIEELAQLVYVKADLGLVRLELLKSLFAEREIHHRYVRGIHGPDRQPIRIHRELSFVDEGGNYVHNLFQDVSSGFRLKH